MIPKFGDLVQHLDGGLYVVLFLAIFTGDSSPVVVYESAYPVPGKRFVRPLEKWTPESYRPLTAADYDIICLQNPDREKFAQEIANRRKQRKGLV